MTTLNAQFLSLNRTRFMQLALFAAVISVPLLSILGMLIMGWQRGLEILLVVCVLCFGSLFVAAVALGYRPNRRTPPTPT